MRAAATMLIQALAALSGPALAAAEESHTAPAASVSSLLFPVLNFAIFSGLLLRYAWPAVRAGLAERRRLVEKDLAEARETHRQAQAGLSEIQSRRSRLDAEGRELMAELRAEAERERATRIQGASQAAERILADAGRHAEQEVVRAAQKVREEVALRVTRRAADALAARLGEPDQERFVREFLAATEAR